MHSGGGLPGELGSDTHTTRRAPLPTPDDEMFEVADEVTAHAFGVFDARPLLGQEPVLTSLRSNIARAFEERRATLTFVEGAAGSGRTRILERASEIVAKNHATACVRYAACRNADEGPYAPFSRLLLERFDITPTSSPSVVREEMLDTARLALPGGDAERCSELAHLLGHIAGVPFPGSAVLDRLQASPYELREHAALALCRLLESDSVSGPLLVLLDDMHRAEGDAWDMLEILLDTAAPIAFVVSGDDTVLARVRALAERAASPIEIAALQPLGDVEVSALVRSLLPALGETPEPFVSALLHRSRGNPTAVNELVRALEERGLFKASAHGSGLVVDLEMLSGGELPLTMSDAIRARLAALDPYELAVIQHASVVGEMFWDGALLALARSELRASALGSLVGDPAGPLALWLDHSDEARLASALVSLETKRFIARVAESNVPGLSEYSFQFTGARAIIYGELPEGLRARAHAVIARWMMVASGLPPEGLSAPLARHLERAGLYTRAAESYLAAADEERGRLRTSMALRYAERALPLVAADELGLRIRALHEHGSLLAILGRYDEAHASFGEIATLAFQIGARGTGGAALNRIARIHRERGEHTRALAYLEQALALFRASDDRRGVASTQDDLAQVHRMLGDHDRAFVSAHEALSIRTASGDTRGQAVSLNTLGFIELDRGNFASSEAHLEAALSIRETIGDHEGTVQTRIGLGKLAYHQGRTGHALRTYRAALDRARELGSQRYQAYLLNYLGEAQLAAGDAEISHGMLIEAQQLAMGLRDQRALSEIQRNLGLVALARSDPGASQQLMAALTLAREYGTREAIALAHRGLARLHARTLFDQQSGTRADAESSFRESIRILEECGSQHELARTQAELGFHLAERGEVPEARNALEQALESMQRLGLPEQERVSQTLGQL